MRQSSKSTVAQLFAEARSADIKIQWAAVQKLEGAVKTDPALHQEALALFREILVSDRNDYAAVTAAEGIEYLAGPAEGRKAWLELLQHPSEQRVVSAIIRLKDPWFGSHLLRLLAERPELRIKRAALSGITRMRMPEAFEIAVASLDSPGMRSVAIQCLGSLQDPRAFPHLERFLADETDADEFGERGFRLCLCDLAHDAIAQITDRATSA